MSNKHLLHTTFNNKTGNMIFKLTCNLKSIENLIFCLKNKAISKNFGFRSPFLQLQIYTLVLLMWSVTQYCCGKPNINQNLIENWFKIIMKFISMTKYSVKSVINDSQVDKRVDEYKTSHKTRKFNATNRKTSDNFIW